MVILMDISLAHSLLVLPYVLVNSLGSTMYLCSSRVDIQTIYFLIFLGTLEQYGVNCRESANISKRNAGIHFLCLQIEQ